MKVEKDDMDVPDTGRHLLKCVWTSHPDHERCCRLRIPAGVVDAAWQQELELNRRHEGFFHFAWRGDVWLAYGLADGRVRGVYCSAHRAERDARSFTLDLPEQTPERTPELAPERTPELAPERTLALAPERTTELAPLLALSA